MDNPAARVVGALSRRVRTLIVSGLLFLVLLILTLTLPVPYVILTPGLTCNTIGSDADCGGKPVITIQGITTRKTTGNLNLTTVYVSTPQQKLTVFDALSAWLQNDQVVVPRSSVYPPGESDADVQKQDTQQFVESQDSATVAAACEQGWRRAFGVVDFTPNSASAGKLKYGDALVSVAGKPADSIDKLKAALAGHAPGETVQVVVTHATQSAEPGPEQTVDVTLGKPLQKGEGGSLGIALSAGASCLAPYHVDLGLADQIGGPSGGLMFALGILDKVGPTDLTNGKFIAGTGTIDNDGKVGAIGGIQLKMIAARDKGATVFLAPADNCANVRGAVPSGLQIVKVSTLHEAVQDLELLENNKPVPSC